MYFEKVMSERKGKSKVTNTASLSHHTKKIRRFFIFCMMLCILHLCTMPLYTLVTDGIEGQGGSAMYNKPVRCLCIS